MVVYDHDEATKIFWVSVGVGRLVTFSSRPPLPNNYQHLTCSSAGDLLQTSCGGSSWRLRSAKERKMLLLIILIVLIFGFGYGGYRAGPGLGYYGGGGISLILVIVLILLLLKVI